jgi:dethiobiotin synthetase
MRSYFVTATGTDIGKTYITAGVLRAARAAGRRVSAIKPVLSGYAPQFAAGSDPAVLLAAMGKRVTHRNIAAIAPWRFTAPLSPDMAAAREHRRVDFGALAEFCSAAMASAPDTLLIEGVGGVAVPLDDRHLVADWISALRIPAILVAGTYLGTISHTLTAAAFLDARGIAIASIVLNESANAPVSSEETAATLGRLLPYEIDIVPRHHSDESFQALAAKLCEVG